MSHFPCGANFQMELRGKLIQVYGSFEDEYQFLPEEAIDEETGKDIIDSLTGADIQDIEIKGCEYYPELMGCRAEALYERDR